MSETTDRTPQGIPTAPIAKGDTGPAVANLIDVLRYWEWAAAGDPVDIATVTYDTKVVNAVKRAQATLGVDQSGAWDTDTATAYAAMVTELAIAGSDAPAAVRPGSDDTDAVTVLQTWLAEHGYLAQIEYDLGRYDLGTEWAVQRLQRKARTVGLDAGPIDGIYGDRTRAAVCRMG